MSGSKGRESRRTAGVYVRISDDRLGDSAGVARQEADCRALAERKGWDIAGTYTENDTSAYHQKRILIHGKRQWRVIRPEFRRMLEDLDAGTITAVVAYDLDRIARDPRDLEDLIDLVKHSHVQVASVTGSLDLSTDAGIAMARVMVAFANKSSADTGRRVSRKHLELAQSGAFGGGGIRPFGYEPDGHTIVEAEAEVIRELADRVIAGESLGALARWLDERGVPPVRAVKWNSRSVHSVLSKARNAGLREYRGEIIGPATWPAVITPETWGQVKTALAERSRVPSGNRLVAWLSGVLICGRCGRPLTYGQQRRRRRYWCDPRHGGCTLVVSTEAEDTVEGWILEWFKRPDVRAALAAAVAGDQAGPAADVVADEEQLAELTAAWQARRITTSSYLEAIGPIETRLKQSRRLTRARTPGAVQRLMDQDNLVEGWGRMTPADKREVARLVFPRGITVAAAEGRRGPGGGWLYEPDRLTPN